MFWIFTCLYETQNLQSAIFLDPIKTVYITTNVETKCCLKATHIYWSINNNKNGRFRQQKRWNANNLMLLKSNTRIHIVLLCLARSFCWREKITANYLISINWWIIITSLKTHKSSIALTQPLISIFKWPCGNYFNFTAYTFFVVICDNDRVQRFPLWVYTRSKQKTKKQK